MNFWLILSVDFAIAFVFLGLKSLCEYSIKQ